MKLIRRSYLLTLVITIISFGCQADIWDYATEACVEKKTNLGPILEYGKLLVFDAEYNFGKQTKIQIFRNNDNDEISINVGFRSDNEPSKDWCLCRFSEDGTTIEIYVSSSGIFLWNQEESDDYYYEGTSEYLCLVEVTRDGKVDEAPTDFHLPKYRPYFSVHNNEITIADEYIENFAHYPRITLGKRLVKYKGDYFADGKYSKTEKYSYIYNFYGTLSIAGVSSTIDDYLLSINHGIISAMDPTDIIVYDMYGTKVAETFSQSLDISTLPKGVYIVQGAGQTLKVRL